MADITVTAANVALVEGVPEDGIAGEAITAGQGLYYNTGTGRWLKAQHDGTAAESGTGGLGIALNSAPGAGQPVKVLRDGVINIGGTVSVGETYYASATAGGICPDADVGSGDYVSFYGVGITTANIRLRPIASGIQHA